MRLPPLTANESPEAVTNAMAKMTHTLLGDGFEVFVERSIGRVEFGGDRALTPFEAAIELIGRHGEDGSYMFPHELGGEPVRVTIEGYDRP